MFELNLFARVIAEKKLRRAAANGKIYRLEISRREVDAGSRADFISAEKFCVDCSGAKIRKRIDFIPAEKFCVDYSGAEILRRIDFIPAEKNFQI